MRCMMSEGERKSTPMLKLILIYIVMCRGFFCNQIFSMAKHFFTQSIAWMRWYYASHVLNTHTSIRDHLRSDSSDHFQYHKEMSLALADVDWHVSILTTEFKSWISIIYMERDVNNNATQNNSRLKSLHLILNLSMMSFKLLYLVFKHEG